MVANPKKFPDWKIQYIKKNRDFYEEHKEWLEEWIPKIEKNIARDNLVNETLENSGWTVLRFWGNDIKKNLQACADEIERTVKSKND